MSYSNTYRNFGEYAEVVEVITPNTPKGQVYRMVHMKSHGNRFQDIIVMVNLKGLKILMGGVCHGV